MNCDDCRSGTVSKATHHVTAHSGLKWCVTKPPTGVPASPTRGAASTAMGNQTPNDPLSGATESLAPMDSDAANPTKRIGGHEIPLEKVNDKVEKYELTQFPRDKLMHLQREDPFGKMIYDYLENDNLPNETKMAKRISIVAEQFVIKEGIL